MTDVVLVGGGAIGCASALALATRGLATTLVERAATGAGASGAAAGVLGAQAEASEDGPLARLSLASRTLFPGWVGDLEERSGHDVGYRRTGVARVALDAAELERLVAETAWQERAGLEVRFEDALAAREREPALSERVAGAVVFPDDARIDPPALLRALRLSGEHAGVRFRVGASVERLLVAGGRVCGVLLADGTRIEADAVVLTAGAWSTLVEDSGLAADAVVPVRGQIVELRMPASPIRRVLFGPRCYLSPRDDGRVLVGASTERVGFAEGVTASAVRDLLDAAIELVPALGQACPTRSWSGLRPCSQDELPLLGQGHLPGLVVAAGHYRNGILLAPVTATIVAALVTGDAPPTDIEAFAVGRVIEAGR